MRISQNLANLFRSISSLPLFLWPFLLPTLSSFLISHESLAGLLSNKGTNLICKEFWVNSKIGSGFFPKCCLKCVFVCNSVRIGQNFLNEVPVQSSILANCAHYHRIHSLNRKLFGYRKDNMHQFIWNKTTKADVKEPPVENEKM